jgi:hypothetical protein
MKRVQNCEVENCIPTPSSCVIWNGGDIEYLGICNGDSLNNITMEIVGKLQDIVNDDLANFDIDSLADICNLKAPQEVTLLGILNLVKANQVCLKDYLTILDEQLTALLSVKEVKVNLKCYADFDNLGNPLSITRDILDQLIIDNLCSQKVRLDSAEGKLTSLQSQINNLSITTVVDELSFATCIDPVVKPTSTQVINTAKAHCDLEAATGTDIDIQSALASTPQAELNADYGGITGWISAPSNWAENYNNLLLQIEEMRQTIKICCAVSCDDVKLGFSAIFTGDSLILKFTSGAGTSIPAGFLSSGSTGTLTDMDGLVESFTLVISNNAEIEIPITGLNTSGPLTVNITAKMTNGSLVCQKCLTKVVTLAEPVCDFCNICAAGDVGASLIVVYTIPNT